MGKGGLRLFLTEGLIEAGCDEAGRGCLAGPVVAAAVILNPERPIIGLNDSKQLSEAKRDALRPEIEQHALAWAVAMCSPDEIDRFNILKCSLMAMHRALDQLIVRPQHIVVDGNRFIPYADVPHHCAIGGDGIFAHVAAASVLAKTHRDELMLQLHGEHPQYAWHRNKGYPTRQHRAAISAYGTTVHHRLSFTLLQPELPFGKQGAG
jgi:ribonuclease HII